MKTFLGSPVQADSPDDETALSQAVDHGAWPWPSLMPWIVFICAIVVSVFIHELGHCVVAWLHGYEAIPTPAKEYVFAPGPDAVQYQVALGGILGSVAALLAGVFCLPRHANAKRSAVLAGAMTAPGFYMLRFILAGRGHDATEFQEAQAALGLSYSGHAVDWLFVGLFMLATLYWFWKTGARLTRRLMGRLVIGTFAVLKVVVLLQKINNAAFDPLSERKTRAGGAAMLQRQECESQATGFPWEEAEC